MSEDEMPQAGAREGVGGTQARTRVSYAQRAVLFVFLVMLVGASVLVLRGRNASEGFANAAAPSASAASDWFVPGPCTPPRRPENPTDEYRRKASQAREETSAEAKRTGFTPFLADDQRGGWVCGYTRPLLDSSSSDVVSGSEAARASAETERRMKEHGPDGRRPVYDAPNGNLLGYSFTKLGFFEAAEVHAPGFDAIALRRQRFGCDLPAETCPGGDKPQP